LIPDFRNPDWAAARPAGVNVGQQRRCCVTFEKGRFLLSARVESRAGPSLEPQHCHARLGPLLAPPRDARACGVRFRPAIRNLLAFDFCFSLCVAVCFARRADQDGGSRSRWLGMADPLGGLDRAPPGTRLVRGPEIYLTPKPQGPSAHACPIRATKDPRFSASAVNSCRSIGPGSFNGVNSSTQFGSAAVPLLTSFWVTTFALMSLSRMSMLTPMRCPLSIQIRCPSWTTTFLAIEQACPVTH